MATRAVVTGACGFNGSHMVDYLLEKGFDVLATDLETADKTYLNPDAEFIPSDVTKIGSLRTVIKGADFVFHPASVLDYATPVDWIKKINVYGTENLCQVSLEMGVKRVIIWSSYAVYGNWHDTEEEIIETSPKSSKTYYEVSKWYQEQIAFKYVKKGLACTTIRPAPEYGPRNPFGISSFIFLVAPFSIVPLPFSMANHIPLVNIRDVVRAALFLSTNDEAIGKAFNIVDNSKYMLREIIEILSPQLGYITIPTMLPANQLIKSALKNSKSGDPRILPGDRVDSQHRHIKYLLKVNQNMSNKRLKELGFEFQFPDSIPGLIETIKWYEKNGWIDKNKLYYKFSQWIIKPIGDLF